MRIPNAGASEPNASANSPDARSGALARTEEQPIVYPYDAWVLLPSFKPKQVTLTNRYASYSSNDYGDVAAGGKLYSRGSIFLTEKAAINDGWRQLAEQQTRIDKMVATMAKKRAALAKAGDSKEGAT